MNRTTAIVVSGILLIVAMLGAWAIFMYVQQAKPANIPPTDTATTTPVVATTTPTTSGTVPVSTGSPVHPYGSVTLALGETARFGTLSITPTEIVEDSRCPLGVLCIQAGTVRVAVRINAASGQSTATLTLDKGFTTEAETITLTGVQPIKRQHDTIATGAYRLTFDVEKRALAGRCYVGGCSSEVCSDQPGAISTCIYREAYGCYKTATCERQSSGRCGWTPTKELDTCLANAS